MSIRENLEAIRAEIDAAARETGRTGADITLVGASKMNDAAACREAIAAGIDALGENRVQEMTAKLAEDAYRGAPLHFIGHLQRNKVKQVVGKVALIQSIGSPELMYCLINSFGIFAKFTSVSSKSETALSPFMSDSPVATVWVLPESSLSILSASASSVGLPRISPSI